MYKWMAGNDEALPSMGGVPPCILHIFYYAKLLEGNSVKGTFFFLAVGGGLICFPSKNCTRLWYQVRETSLGCN